MKLHEFTARTWMAAMVAIALMVLSTPIQITNATSGQPTVNVSNDALTSSDGHVAVSGSHAYVVWTSGTSGGLTDVFFRSSSNGGITWGSATNLSNDPGKSFNARVRAQGNNVYVFWTDNSTGPDEIFERTSRDSGVTWSSVNDLSNTVAPSRHARILVFGSSLYLAWVENVGKNNEVIFRSSHDDGATWSPAADLSNSVNDSENIRLGTSGNTVFVAWMDDSPGHFQVFLRSSSNGGSTWNPTFNVANDTGNAIAADLTVLAGNVYFTWQDDTVGNNETMFRMSHDLGTTWTNTTNLSFDTGNSVNPTVQAQTSGTQSYVYVTWTDSTTGKNSVFFAMSTNGGASFGKPLNLGSDSVASAGTRLLVQSHRILVSWSDSTPGNRDIFLGVSLNFGVSFASAVNLSTDTGASVQMSFSDNDQGSGGTFVIWTDTTTGAGDIYIHLVPSGADTLNLLHLPVALRHAS